MVSHDINLEFNYLTNQKDLWDSWNIPHMFFGF
jgi:hypothetical protein